MGLDERACPNPETAPKPRLSADAARVLRYATTEDDHLGNEQVNALHLLLGSLYENEGRVREVLREARVSLLKIRGYALECATKSARRSKRELGVRRDAGDALPPNLS